MVGAWLTNERQDSKNDSSDGIKVAYIFEPYGVLMAPQIVTNKYATWKKIRFYLFLK